VVQKLGIILSALIGVALFVVVFALGVWLQNTPQSGPIVYTKIGDAPANMRTQMTVFVAPDLFISLDPQSSDVSYAKLVEPLKSDSLRVYAYQNAIVVDGFIAYGETLFEQREVQEISSEIWKQVVSDHISSSFSRWQLLSLSKSLNKAVYKQHVELVFVESAVVDEELNIGVYNGTSVSGLATEASRWIENIGGDVVEVGNAPEKLEKTSIKVYVDVLDSPTIARLQRIFHVDAVTLEKSESLTRFDVVVTVGDDFYRQ